MEALKTGEHWTYADYCGWDDDTRYELIDGEAYVMSPAPAWKHQSLSGRLFYKLANFLYGKPCQAFTAPFDVRLNADGEDDTVVQPDIVVICDRSKLSGTGCIGAPDMAIEILSPSTSKRDLVTKFNLYRRYGVREYWIVDPDSKTVTAHILKDGEYVVQRYAEEDSAPVHILDGCVISLTDVFAE